MADDGFICYLFIQTCIDRTFIHDKAAGDLGYKPLVSKEEVYIKKHLNGLRIIYPR
ncbi:MAG: hypothetical protein M1409_07925 [Actinobacteria bacterium]|nr:hypothetical protein [Actinomycetota bacterium]